MLTYVKSPLRSTFSQCSRASVESPIKLVCVGGFLQIPEGGVVKRGDVGVVLSTLCLIGLKGTDLIKQTESSAFLNQINLIW